MDSSVSPRVPFHHWKIHPVASWTAVLGAAFAAMLPVMLLAQEAPSSPPPPMGGQQYAPPPMGGQPSMPSTDGSQQYGIQPPGGVQQPPMPGGQQYAPPPTGSQPGTSGGQQFGPPQGGGQGFGGQGMGQESGEKMQQQQQQQRQQQEKAQLERVKREMTNFSKQLVSIKAKIASLEKRGVKIPQDLTDAIAEADDLLAKIKAATSFDELQEIGDIGQIMGDIGNTLQEQLPNLERLANLQKIYGRIDRQLKTFDRQYASDKILVAKSKIDISSALNDFADALSKVKASYAEAKNNIAAGDIEGGFDMLQSDVFDAMNDVGQYHATIQQIGKLSTIIPQIDREIKNDQRQVDRLKAKKLDTTEVQSIIDEGKARVADLKAAASAKPMDPEAIFALLDDLGDVRDRFASAMNDLLGIREQSDIDVGIKAPTINVPQFGGMFEGGPVMAPQGGQPSMGGQGSQFGPGL